MHQETRQMEHWIPACALSLENFRPIKSYNLCECVEFGFYERYKANSNHAIYVIKDTYETGILISKIFYMNYSHTEL